MDYYNCEVCNNYDGCISCGDSSSLMFSPRDDAPNFMTCMDCTTLDPYCDICSDSSNFCLGF